MKKSYPPHTQNPEELYAKVNKPGRAQRPHNLEETVYAEVNTGARGAAKHQRPEETIYAEVNTEARGAARHQHPEETIYAEVNTEARGAARHQPEATPRAEAHTREGIPPVPPRGTAHITVQLLKNADIQYGTREIQHWCAVVFGNQHALNVHMAKIHDNPKNAENILLDVMANPESIGPFAGRQVLGIKTPQRREAEGSFVPLCAALERHIQTVQKVYKDLTREQTREHGHERNRNPERAEHRAHHRAREQKQTSQEQDVQQRRGGKMALAM